MKHTIIIAEAGVNHNGDIELAKKLIDAAEEAGADYVKFQTFKAEKLVSKHAAKADYQVANMDDTDNSQYKMLKKLELDLDAHNVLINYCKEKKIEFLSTGFDEDSIDMLYNLGIKIFKIPSGEITNLPYLQKMATLNKPIVLSTGMSTLDEVESALNVLINGGVSKDQITVLHCNTEYPTPMSDVNLKAMNTIGKELGVKVGYSDHTLGIEVPIAAVALGASCIEKHFTLDRKMQGPDHRASLEPLELKMMVSSIRNIEKALGSTTKRPSESEKKNIPVARRSIHMRVNAAEGHVITYADLVMKRPGTGISPMDLNNVLGRKLIRAVSRDSILSFKDLAK